MKALSIQQPWAWLIVNGYKDIENRSWPTNVRGEVLIHAGKTFDHDGYEWLCRAYPEFMMITVPAPERFERGGIVGRASLLACVTASSSRWFFGPYGFLFADAAPLPLLPMRGRLGFFAVTADCYADQAQVPA